MPVNRFITSLSAALLGVFTATAAMAIPTLQLFIEGADYETSAENSVDGETWAKLGTDSFRLWVLGSAGEGTPAIDATHRIRDVKFVASFDDGLNPVLAFTPTTTSQYGPLGDLSIPVPVIGPLTGSPFPDGDSDAENWAEPDGPMGAHGMLKAGRTAKEWNLGNFELTDSPIGNTQPGVSVEAGDNWFPTATSQRGQINVYDMAVSGLPVGAQVHFDVYGVEQEMKLTGFTSASCSRGAVQYNTSGLPNGCSRSGVLTIIGAVYKWEDIEKSGKPGKLSYVNAPFSHDARWEQVALDVPTPGTAALLLGGLSGLGWFTRRRGARQAPLLTGN